MSDVSQTLKYSHTTKTNPLTQDETELYELSNLAGIVWDPKIFKIVLGLLRMNVAPTAIEQMLKSMTASAQKKPSAAATLAANRSSSASQPSTTGN